MACAYEADHVDGPGGGGPGNSGSISQGGAVGGGNGGASGGDCHGALVECAGECVNLKRDEANCGSCGTACAAAEHCVDETCSCSGEKMLCAAECVDIASAPAHCGACDNACGALEVCALDVCKPDCGELLKCDRACVDPTSNADHCGRCNVKCEEGWTCRNGNCECPDGQEECGGTCFSPNDRAHCGGCDSACEAGSVCSDGQCVIECRSWETDCGGSCFDLETDHENCGECGAQCPPEQQCVAGECGCPGKTACGESCVDLEGDRAHCGDCATRCGDGTVCSLRACAVSCAPELTNCNGSCVDLRRHHDNCGGCGKECPAQQSCTGEECVCPGSQVLCDDVCVSPLSDNAHCGGCNQRCPQGQVCANGGCEVSCQPGQENCAGACVVLQTNREHCGECGKVCSLSDQQCINGDCACPPGKELCDTECANPQSDRAHCGTCGNACAAGSVCSRGVCVPSCAEGLTNCAGSCVDLNDDHDHCGSCESSCQDEESCTNKECACPGSQVLCERVCVSPLSDNAHCGGCNQRCPQGQVCANGGCEVSCQPGQENCAGACVVLQTEREHCGECGHACSVPDQRCIGGECSCASGKELCGGECVNTQTDRVHCGVCGNACAAGSVCSLGRCEPSCAEGLTDCGGSCVDLQDDHDHCASCDTECPGGQSCRAGICSCPGNQVLCDNTCVSPLSDNAHCGGCNQRCTQGQVCSNGHCEVSCQNGQTNCGGSCVDLRKDEDHCGACDFPCAAEQSCHDGVCSCPGSQILCGTACVEPRFDPANCGVCAQHCPSGQVCAGGSCSAGSPPEPRCQSTLPIGLNAHEGWPREAPPSCEVLADGTGRMTYQLPTCGDGPYASCIFANAVNLNAFDADNGAAGILEVEFCASRVISGELNLWYGAVPTRKKIQLLGPGEVMMSRCLTVRRAPEEAVCHWTAHETWSGDCTGADVPGRDKSCRACGLQCNEGCPIHFSSARLELTAEQCTLPQSEPVTIDLKSVRFLPEDCACTNSGQCADSPDRTKCETGLFSSRVCPAGAPICGACVSPTPTCHEPEQPCGDVCVDTQTNAANCGACGKACAIGEACEGGACVTYCPPGLTECSGSCVDLDNDPEHCGACETSCAFADGIAACVDRTCRLAGCEAGFVDADGTQANGCECRFEGNDDPCDGEDNNCDGIKDWQAEPFPHLTCPCYGADNLVRRGERSSPNGSPEQCRPTTCETLPSGAMEMSYCFRNTCSSVYATCIFAGPTDLESFDVDFGNSGFLEVTFEVVSPTLVGKLHLSYGKDPSRKYVTLVERGEVLAQGTYKKYFAPEQVRYASASLLCTEMCGACPAVRDNPSYRFDATDMTLVGEGCASAVDATIRLDSVLIASRGCPCSVNADCAAHDARKTCEPPSSGSGPCGWPTTRAPGVCGTSP